MDRIVRFRSCRWSASQAVETSRVDLSPWPPQAAEAELVWCKVKAAMKKERRINRERHIWSTNLIYIVSNYIVLRRNVSRAGRWVVGKSVLGFHVSCQREGRQYALTGVSDRLMTLFRVAGVNGMLTIATSVAEAEDLVRAVSA